MVLLGSGEDPFCQKADRAGKHSPPADLRGYVLEDVLQEVFIEFFNNPKLEENTNIKLYLAKLAKNRAIDLYRKKKTKLEYSEGEIESFGTIDESMYNLELNLSGQLTNRETHIVTKKVLLGYTFNEIAQELDAPIGTIQSIYYAALEKLKKYYKGV